MMEYKTKAFLCTRPEQLHIFDSKSSEEGTQVYYITRGSSKSDQDLQFSIGPGYTAGNISLVTNVIYLFSQNNEITEYALYDEAGETNEKFSLSPDPLHQDVTIVSLKLDEEDTKLFDVTRNKPVKFEIVVQYDFDGPAATKCNYTTIYSRNNIIVLDSLYGQLEQE